MLEDFCLRIFMSEEFFVIKNNGIMIIKKRCKIFILSFIGFFFWRVYRVLLEVFEL